jgi:hypothetical protein
MLTNEEKEKLSVVAEAVFVKYFGDECSPALFRRMEAELSNAFAAILNCPLLVYCYEYGCNPVVTTVRAETHYKRSDGYIAMFENVFTNEVK